MARVADVFLVFGGVVSTLSLGYALYRYAWTGDRQLGSVAGLAFYYILPACFAFFFFFSLRLQRIFRINLALLCVSLVVAAYGAELFLQLANPALPGSRKPVMSILNDSQNKKADAIKLGQQFGVDIDARDGSQVVADLRKKGLDAVSLISPGNTLLIKQADASIKSALVVGDEEIIPLGAISNKLTVLCNESGYYVTYESDGYGLNNPREIWRSAFADVATLGDSYPHGYCVSSDANFVSLVRKQFPATFNLGMAGHGPLMMLATINEYLSPFKPKSVLWFYYEGNDLVNLQDERKSSLLLRYLQDGFSQRLAARQPEIDRAILEDIPRQRALEGQRRERRLGGGIKFGELIKFGGIRKRLGAVDGVTKAELNQVSDLGGANIDVFRDILSKAKSRVNGWGGALYFVYLPGWARYAGYAEVGAKQRASVLKIASALNLNMIDIHPAFERQSDPLSLFPFREPGHYNEKGHRLVAQEVLKVLSSR